MTKHLWPFGQQRFSVTPWVLSTEGLCRLSDLKTPGPAVKFESPRLIIARQFLFYLYVDLDSVPHAQRSNLIQQRLQQVSPFKAADSWIVQEGDAAQVWFWDADLVRRVCAPEPSLCQRAIPETLVRNPHTQGFRLQRCLAGWEMQYWASGRLRHTRWLLSKPDGQTLADFVRTCGYTLDQGEWAEADDWLLSGPWNEKPLWNTKTLTSEPVASRLIAGVLLGWVALELGMGLGTLLKESYLSSSVAEKKNGSLMELISQRDGALRQQEFNQAVNGLVSAPSPLLLAAQIHQCTGQFDYAILDWQYQRGQVVLVVQKDNLDTRALIESCATRFADVRVEPGITPDQTRVLFNLSGAVTGSIPDA